MSSNSNEQQPAEDSGAWARSYNVLGYIGGLILAIMTAAVVLQVVVRHLGTGIDGLDEIPRFLFLWLVMVGAAAAMQRGEHTVLDYFANKLAPRRRALMNILTNMAAILFFAYMIKLSLVLVPNAQLQTSAGLGLPLGWVYAAVPVGSLLMILPLARNVLRAMRGLRDGRQSDDRGSRGTNLIE
jgi:TRAP-type C4-dicarboxylate transport system permease small subunit